MKKIIFPVAAFALFLAASCSKEKVTAPVEQSNPSKISTISASGGNFNSLQLYSGAFRKVNADGDGCNTQVENCHPEDCIGLTRTSIAELNMAISGGPLAIRDLFSNDIAALEYIPEWNSDWFKDVKVAILSGGYNFYKSSPNTYLLGKASVVSPTNFDYALIIKP